jgi:MFS family permease
VNAGDPPRWNRSVTALLINDVCAAAAAFAGVTALGKLVYDITGSKLDLGLLGLVEFAPAALLVLVTGAVADRYDRRVVAALGSLGEAVVALLLAAHVGRHPDGIAVILGLVLVFGIARSFVAPASRALPVNVVAPEHLPWLIPRYSAMWQAALIVGPVIGGSTYAIDPRYPFYAMAGLAVLAAISVMFIQVRPSTVVPRAEPRGGLHDALEGLRFIRQQPVLLGAISLDLFAVLFGGAVALLPAIAEDRLHVGAVGLGWLRAAGGIGAAVITLGLARRPLARHVGRTLLVVVAVFGVGTIALGLTHSYVVAFVAMAVLSGADAVSVFIRATLVPLVTPAEKRGRVLAVENVFIGASNELGAFESGVAGQLLGPGGAVVLGGVATLVVASSWWVLFPDLRDVEGFPTGPASAASDAVVHTAH